MTPEQLQEIRTRAEAATIGPWGVETQGRDVTVLNRGTGVLIAGRAADGDEDAERDAEFIAAARDDVQMLLDEVDRLRAALAEARYDARLMERHANAATRAYQRLRGEDPAGEQRPRLDALLGYVDEATADAHLTPDPDQKETTPCSSRNP